MDFPDVPRKLWEHPNKEATEMHRFMLELGKIQGQSIQTFQDLYNFSITRRATFWGYLFQFLNIIHIGSYTHVFDENARMDSVPRWFEGIKLNFAENLLYRRTQQDRSSTQGTTGKEDHKIAVTEVREGGSNVQSFTWGQLRRDVGYLANAMKEHGARR